MRRRIVKISVLAFLSAAALLVIFGAAFFWRLSQGPVGLDFLTTQAEAEINKALPGMRASIGGVVFELDRQTGIPHVRLRDMTLRDDAGNLIARSERAAIGLGMANLMAGNFQPESIELIGTRLLVKRQIDGTVSLGFGESPSQPEAQQAGDEAPDSGKSDMQKGASQSFSMARARPLLELLSGTNTEASTALLEDIKITGASLQLFDEVNQATWFAPQADLTFRRMPYGFVVFAKAAVTSGPTNWQTEVSATYRKEQRSFSVSARIFDLIPANVADKIFALSQIARMNMPLSGHADMEISDEGVVLKASAELSAAAGVVDLPDYFANPIVVDEGALRVDYEAATGAFNIVDSILLMGGTRVELGGRVTPLRDPQGRLTDVDIVVKASNVSVDTQGTVKEPVIVDRVEFTGRTSIQSPRLDIQDLLVMSGAAGVRLRGVITGGEQSAGILMSGRLRDISADFLKKLWPPVIGPKSRAWVSENVAGGRISEGSFQINIPPNGLAVARTNKVLPNEAIDFRFSLQDVTSRYFKNLPLLTNASGQARLQGNVFDLTIDSGTVTVSNGGKVRVSDTTFKAENLLADPADGTIVINVNAGVPELLALAWEPDLNLYKTASGFLQKATGSGAARISLSLPLVKNVPREMVNSEAELRIEDGAMQAIMPGIDIAAAKLAISARRGSLKVSGPARINGFPAQIGWERAGPESKPKASLTATLDDDDRKKLGIDISAFMSGPMKLKADFSNLGSGDLAMDAEVDLSEASMRLSAINWSRPPTAKTVATFTYGRDGDRPLLKDLVIKGPGLSIKGDVALGPKNTLRSAEFSQVWLNEENNFAMTVRPNDGVQVVTINGNSFDARPFIKSMFSRSPAGGSAQPKSNINLQARLRRIIAHRGEIITEAAADIIIRNGTVTQADIRGGFLSGAPIVVRVKPSEDGRSMELNSGDGGATLRAVNLYSKVAGGQLIFTARLASQGSSIQNGRMLLRGFAVRNEAALAQVDSRGRQRKSGPRREGLTFKRMSLRFTADDRFIKFSDTILEGSDIGAVVDKGLIRKSDGAIDITGTIIPMYEVNSLLSKVPIVGLLITGGKGQGIFGVTFALGGTFARPQFQVNPASAIAPGILRKFFEFSGPGGSSLPKKTSDR